MIRTIGKNSAIFNLVNGNGFMVTERTKGATVFSLTAMLAESESGRETLVAYKPNLFAVTMLADNSLSRGSNIPNFIRIGLLCV